MRLHYVSKKLFLFLALSVTSIVLILFYLTSDQFTTLLQNSNPKLLQTLSQGFNRKSSDHSRRMKGSLRLLPQGQEESPGPEEYGDGDDGEGKGDNNEERGDDEEDDGKRDDNEEDGGYDDDEEDGHHNDDGDGSEEDNSEDSEAADESTGESTDGGDNSGSSDDGEEHAHYPEDVEISVETSEACCDTPGGSEEVIVIPDNSTTSTATPESCSGSTPYMFLNGTCTANCPTTAGYLIQINASSTTAKLSCVPCDSSCASCADAASTCTSCASNTPYLYTNHSCLATCPESSYTIKELTDGRKTCITKDSLNVTVNSTPRLSLQQQQTARAVSNYTVTGGTLASIGLACSQLKNPGAAGNLALMLLLNQIDYIKYFDINYSPLLMEVFNNQVNNLISFDFQFNFPYGNDGDHDRDDTSFYQTPHRISRFDTSGLFVANLWGEIITVVVLVGATLMIFVFQRVSLSLAMINKILNWLQNLLAWNFFLVFMLSNISDITFYSIIEYQSHYPGTSLSICSLILATLFILTVVGILVFAFYKLYQLNKNSNASFEEKLKANYKTRVLFEEVKDQFWTQRYFILITSTRAILCATITSAINLPTLQISLLTTFNLAMITYLAYYRPLRTRFGNIELIVYEILVLIANITCFRLSLLDPQSQASAYTSSDVIIVVNITYVSFMILAQAYGRGRDLWEFYKEFKKQRSSNKVIPTLKIEEQSPRQCPEKDRQAQDDDDNKSQDIIENEDEIKQPLTFRDRGFSSPNSDTNVPDNMSSINEDHQKDLENGKVRRMMSVGPRGGGFTPKSDTNIPDSMSAINEDTREIEVSHQRRLSIGFRGLSVPDTTEGNIVVGSLSSLNEESNVKERDDENKKVRTLKYRGSLTLISESSLPEELLAKNDEKMVEMKMERRIKRITLIE